MTPPGNLRASVGVPHASDTFDAPMLTTARTAQPSAAADRLKTSEYIGYALGDTASNFFFQTFNIFLTYYYVDVWGIPATALLWMMPIVRLIGAFEFGHRCDVLLRAPFRQRQPDQRTESFDAMEHGSHRL